MMMFPHLRSSKRAPVAEPGEAYNNNDDDNHKRISNTSTNTTNTSLSSLHSSLSERLIVPILINNDSSTSNGSNTAEDRTKRTASSQTKKKKQVSFACGGASIQIVPARRHYTKKQRAKIWYSAEELKAIAGEIRQIIQFMIGLEDEGEEAYVEYYQQQQQQIPLITTTATASSRAPPAASPVDEEDVVGCTPSTRGLEALTPYGARHKKIVMLDGMCAVFLEQEKQKQLNIKNADRIREAYVAYTHEAAIAARERGQSDACLNRDDDDDDDDENYEDANVEEEKQQESEEEVSIFSSETVSLATTVETDRSSELFLIKEAAAAYSAGNGGTTTTAGGPATGTATGPGKKRRSIVKRLLTGRHFR
mmetsp:Transcript_14497/g.23535  ORF Transcript_14497/g.23535 Transcript_14497/m.23535 type:complete len:365 (+) Transcript_14497:167-1261(+)